VPWMVGLAELAPAPRVPGPVDRVEDHQHEVHDAADEEPQRDQPLPRLAPEPRAD
jgi:hypothetical protein